MHEYDDFMLSRFKPIRLNDNGFLVVHAHYSCREDRDPKTPEGRAWRIQAEAGVPSRNEWNREQEIDWMATCGQPIFPDFEDARHTAEALWGKPMEPIPGLPLIRATDPGARYSVCEWMQVINPEDKSKPPQVRIYEEQCSVDADVGELAKDMVRLEDEQYAAWKGQIWDFIDIAANQPSQTSKLKAIEIFGTYGINARYRKSGPEDRILQINFLLNHTTEKGEPCFVMNASKCPRLYAGCRGLYRRKEGSMTIEQNEARHPVDAAGYGIDNNLYLRFKRKETEQKKTRPNLLAQYGIDGDHRYDERGWRSL